MKVGTDYFFYQNDHLGTPQKLTSVSGAVVWSAKYNSFGKATIDGSSTVTNNLRFPGQYEDAESGLYYNNWRYYDSSLGRYLRIDPIGFDGGINLYAYVLNKPLVLIDPLGLDHRTGQWKNCGGGCRIRIDGDAVGNGRHLHWECRGSSGEMGENGGVSHGGTYQDAPRRILDCARRHGFNPEPARPDRRCEESDPEDRIYLPPPIITPFPMRSPGPGGSPWDQQLIPGLN